MKSILIIASLLLLLGPADARPRHSHSPQSSDLGTILSHPAGCPRSAFCGCGVSVRVYGHPVRDLYPASAWGRFPRTIARAGAVAIWHHHVAYIESISADGSAMLYDPNSGRHLTRLHAASLRGAIIVDPNGNIASPRYATRVHGRRMASHALDMAGPGVAMQYY